MARSSIGRASASEAEGCEFEPRRAIQLQDKRVPQTMNNNIVHINMFLIYLEEIKTSIPNISVCQMVGEDDWILFDFEHNYVLKTFNTEKEAKYFLDIINQRELYLLERSGYFDQ